MVKNCKKSVKNKLYKYIFFFYISVSDVDFGLYFCYLVKIC